MSDLFGPSRRRTRAFTLVELLVVIGVIAVLISILLPSLSAAQRSSRRVKCMANLRTLGQTLALYTTENKGSFPFGFYADPNRRTDPYVDWVSVLDWYMTRQARRAGPSAGIDAFSYSSMATTPRYKVVSGVFNCPEVDNSIFNTSTSYTMHPVILPDIMGERYGYDVNSSAGLGAGARVSPAKVNQIYPDNVLCWDSNAMSWDMNDIEFAGTSTFVLSETAIDDANLMQPTVPTLRYRLRAGQNDPYRLVASKREASTIYLPKKTNPPEADVTYDADITNGYWTSQIGQLRFRHGKQNQTNILLGDFSVTTINLDKTKGYVDGRTGAINKDLYLVEIYRKQLRIKRAS